MRSEVIRMTFVPHNAYACALNGPERLHKVKTLQQRASYVLDRSGGVLALAEAPTAAATTA